MKTVSLYDGSRSAQFQFDPGTLDTQKAIFLARAKSAAETLTGAPLTGVALTAFESNVERWMNKGFEGHFSLGKALESADPSAKRVSQIDVRTIGHEVELGTAGLRKPGIRYGEELAATDGKSTIRELASGAVVDKATKWPLMKITADGVSDKFPGKAHIEVVFGPVALDDHKEITRRGRTTALLQRALTEHAFFGKPPTSRQPQTLSEAIGRYNKLLASEPDRLDMAKYKLTVSDDVALSIPTMPSPSVQTNVEIPLRKLGDVNDASVLALFGVNEGEDKRMFIKAREEASRIVDTILQPTASDVHGGRYDPASLKLDKLRGTLTLALLFIGKADQFDKQHWPFLPKTGAGDIIRTALSVRDKLTLHHHTGDSGRLDAFVGELVKAGKAVNAERGRAVEVSFDLGTKMDTFARSMFEPGTRTERWGGEADCYGTLLDHSKENWSTGTSTGKDLPIGMDYTKKLLSSQVPKIVVELRRSDNPMSSSFEHLSKYDPKAAKMAKTPLDQQATYKSLVAAAAHGPERPSKGEL